MRAGHLGRLRFTQIGSFSVHFFAATPSRVIVSLRFQCFLASSPVVCASSIRFLLTRALLYFGRLICRAFSRDLFRLVSMLFTNRPNQSLQPTALWRCASMSILISVFSTVAQPRSQSGG